jgi:hypothetical protein
MADFKWIDDCSDGIAKHSLQLLDEIFDQMALGKRPILLSLYDPASELDGGGVDERSDRHPQHAGGASRAGARRPLPR